MSELKRLNSFGNFDKFGGYYDADEVDAAIAELKEFAEDACFERDDNQNAIDELQAENAELKQKLEDVQASAENEARHNKYKRCLAMANFCFTKSLFLRYVLADRVQNGENYISANDWRINLYEKWCERFKKLAEQFKEAK